MTDERQALKRLLAYALNELESIGVDVNLHSITGTDKTMAEKTLVEWCNATDRYEATDD